MRYLFLSVLIHGFLIAIIYGYKFPKNEKEKTVELLVFSSNSGKKSDVKSKKIKPQSLPASEVSTTKLSNTSIIAKHLPKYDVKLNGANTYNGYSGSSELDGKWEGDLVGNIKNTPFISALWNRINNNLIYPHDFVEQDIEGGVTVKLVTDRQGRLKELVSVETKNILLELYITSFVYQLLQKPLYERHWSTQDENPLALHFDFRSTVNEFNAGAGVRFVQRSLIFERFATYEGRINKRLRKIMDKYMIPIIVFPGGFYVDLVRLYKIIEHLAGKPTEEQARIKRLKILKEEFEREKRVRGS